MQIEKFNPTVAELTKKAESCKNLIIKGIDDKEGYEAVHKARMDLVKTRGDVKRTGKELRAEANAFSKAVIEKEKELLKIIVPVEEDLKAKQAKIDEEKEIIKRKELLPIRKERLKEIDIELTDDEINLMDASRFSEFFNKKKEEYLNKKELEMQEAKRKAEEAERKAIEAQEAAEAEKKRQLELEQARKEAAELAKKEVELAAAKRLDEEKARLAREAQEKEEARLAEEAAKKAAEEKAKKEAEEKEAARLAAEAQKKKEEAEAEAKRVADKKYQNFLQKNGVTKAGVEDGSYIIKKTEDGYAVYTFVDSIKM